MFPELFLEGTVAGLGAGALAAFVPAIALKSEGWRTATWLRTWELALGVGALSFLAGVNLVALDLPGLVGAGGLYRVLGYTYVLGFIPLVLAASGVSFLWERALHARPTNPSMV